MHQKKFDMFDFKKLESTIKDLGEIAISSELNVDYVNETKEKFSNDSIDFKSAILFNEKFNTTLLAFTDKIFEKI
jgi:hypothetical protein